MSGRPADVYNLTPLGRQAAATSIEDVCSPASHETCNTLTDDERRFLQSLMDLSQAEYAGFVRTRCINVDLVFDTIGLQSSNEQQEAFLLPLVVRKCVDYREFAKDRDARPLFTGAICASGASRS